jgi:hypothetical protein
VSQQCPGCGEDVTPHQFDLAQAQKPEKPGEPGGGYYMSGRCPNCNIQLGRAEEPAPAPPPEQPTAPSLDGVMSLGGLIGHDRAAAVTDAPAPAAPPPTAPAPCAPPSTDSIIETATARLAFVEAEIVKLRGFEDERALLERMLAAAAPQSGERDANDDGCDAVAAFYNTAPNQEMGSNGGRS